MRRYVLAFLTFGALGAAPVPARAEAIDYLVQALGKLVAVANEHDIADCDYDGAGCLYGFFLDDGMSNGVTRVFEEGREYIVLAVGDDDVQDLDLKLLPMGGGDPLIEDVLTDAVPVMKFTVNEGGRYEIAVINADSNDEPSFCTVVVLVKDPYAPLGGKKGKKKGGGAGGGFNFQEVVEGLDRIISAVQTRQLFSGNFPSNELILFGGRYDAGLSNSTYDYKLSPGSYVAMATGSSGVADVDLEVVRQDQRGDLLGQVVDEDIEDDALPICNFDATGDDHYGLTVKNAVSDGPGFVFAMLLQDD